MAKEAREAAALGFIRIHGKRIVAKAPGMNHVVSATAEAPSVPSVHQIKNQRAVDADGWMQALGRLPGPITNSGHAFTVGASRMQRNFNSYIL